MTELAKLRVRKFKWTRPDDKEQDWVSVLLVQLSRDWVYSRKTFWLNSGKIRQKKASTQMEPVGEECILV